MKAEFENLKQFQGFQLTASISLTCQTLPKIILFVDDLLAEEYRTSTEGAEMIILRLQFQPTTKKFNLIKKMPSSFLRCITH